jgi:uncharacterized protein (TIGR00661 family)
MKILYAIQGTGNGHISRALEIVPRLMHYAETDVLISGSHYELEMPFPVKYKMHGLGFIFGKKGGVDILKTYLKLDTARLIREIKSLPVHEYDLVISDFEPVSCWAAYLRKKACFGLSNQAVTLHPLAPQPGIRDPFGRLILEHYAPCTKQYGFHFRKFDESVFTPVIRKEVRNAVVSDKGHITVYLPSYKNEKIIKSLEKFKGTRFEVFSKHGTKAENHKNIFIQPLNKELFLESMASSSGVICNAGFGTASEALFLNKKLLVIPMKNQYEQHCNAAVLSEMGVTTVKSFKNKHQVKIAKWLKSGEPISVNYPDQTDKMIQTILEDYKKYTTEKLLKEDDSIDFEYMNMPAIAKF